MEYSKGKLHKSFNNAMTAIRDTDYDAVKSILTSNPEFLLENCKFPYSYRGGSVRDKNSPSGFKNGETPLHAASMFSIFNFESHMILMFIIYMSEEKYPNENLIEKKNANGRNALSILLKKNWSESPYFQNDAEMLIDCLIEGSGSDKV